MGNVFVPAIGRQLHRGTALGAAITLPAAGAETTLADTIGAAPAKDYPAGAFQVPAGIYTVSFWLTYTRGAAGGAVAVGAMVGNGMEQARSPVVDDTISSTADPGYGQQKVWGQDLAPQLAPSGAGAVTYPPIRVAVQPGEFVWLQAAETGVPLTPGTLFVALTGTP